MRVGTLAVDLKMMTAQFDASLRKSTNNFTRQMQRMQRSARRMRAGVVGAFAAIGGAKLASDLVRVNSSFEKMRASMETVTGSVTVANAAFSKLQDFAKTTPFTLDQSIEAFIKLKALGLDPSERALRSFGNTSAAMGKDLTQMIEAVADASTGEMERLKEFGIKASQEGDRVKFVFQGVTTEIGRNADEITEYLTKIGENQFGGAMDRMMGRLPGKLSNLEDSFMRLADAIGQGGFTTAVGEAADELGAFITELIDSGKAAEIGTVLGEGIKFAAESATLFARAMAAASRGLTQAGLLTQDWVTGQSFGSTEKELERIEAGIARIKKQKSDLADFTAELNRRLAEESKRPGIRPDNEPLDIIEIYDPKDLSKALSLDAQFDVIGNFQKETENLNRLRNYGLIEAEVHTRALAAENENLRRSYTDLLMSTRDWSNGAMVALSDYYSVAKDAAYNTYTVFDNAFKGLEDSLVDAFTGVKFSFKDMAASIQADLTRMAVRQQITGPLAGMLGLAGGGPGFLFGGAFAGGGMMLPNTVNLVGERGPELVIPQVASAVVPNHQLGGAGGGSLVGDVNVFIQGDASEDVARRTGAQVSEDVTMAIIAAQRNL